MTTDEPANYLLVLRDCKPGDDEFGPAANRLKLALKTLLRRFGFRCQGAIETPCSLAGIITALNSPRIAQDASGTSESTAGPKAPPDAIDAKEDDSTAR